MPSSSSPPPRTPGRIVRDGGRLIVRFVRRQPAAYALAATGAVMFTGAIVASAYVIGRITDDLVVPVLTEGAPLAGRLRTGLLMILAVALWKTFGIVLRRSAAGWLQARNQQRLQQDLVRHQLELSLRWYGSRPTGDLLSVTDADARQATYVLAPLPFATGVTFLLFAATGLVVATDPVLGVLAGVLLVLVVAIDVHGAARMFAGMAEEQRRKGVLGDIAHESFDGALTVKALGREDRESARFAAATEDLREQYLEIGRIWATYRAVTEGLPALGTIALVLIGTIRIASGALTTGELVQVAYLLSLLGLPMRMFGFLMWDLAESVAGWERVRTVLDVDDRVTYGDLPATEDGGAAVAADTISFGYGDGRAILEQVALDLSPGRTLAVVGPTGSGKSTLAVLLARLWDPEAGRVTLDGRDLRMLARGAVAAEVAYVAQEGFLFDDTVAGNITLGRRVPRADIEAAAELAAADGFIRALPDGYDTLVGERGTSLSGGEQQRVALARALLRRPRLLILDDATSALDPSVETRILERLTDAELPATVVIVASRRSSILLADEICYLERGRVVAVGPHERLLADVPGYARLLEAYTEPGERVGVEGGVA